MPRYFIEVAYKGTNYSGFQIQHNANSIQSEVEKALSIFFKQSFNLTGASRTDAGVHALQNFFHFDIEEPLTTKKTSNKIINQKVSPVGGDLEGALACYHLNSILPWDITIKNLFIVNDNAHCRYDALEREYKYYIFHKKNPFLKDRAYFFPYTLSIDKLNTGADIIQSQQDFTSFSKRSTQVNNFICSIYKSNWSEEADMLIYTVVANRFLRGMVRGLVGTMLKFGRSIISENDFKNIFFAKDCSRADFSVPALGLFLNRIKYPETIFYL